MACLEIMYVDRGARDKLVWKWTFKGHYSFNSFCRSALTNNEMNVDLWRSVWAGLLHRK